MPTLISNRSSTTLRRNGISSVWHPRPNRCRFRYRRRVMFVLPQSGQLVSRPSDGESTRSQSPPPVSPSKPHVLQCEIDCCLSGRAIRPHITSVVNRCWGWRRFAIRDPYCTGSDASHGGLRFGSWGFRVGVSREAPLPIQTDRTITSSRNASRQKRALRSFRHKRPGSGPCKWTPYQVTLHQAVPVERWDTNVRVGDR